jgi:excisionase family DNA binding protein
VIERHYRPAEVAELLGIHVETLRRLALRREIRFVWVGRDRRYPESAIAEFLRRNAEPARRGVRAA